MKEVDAVKSKEEILVIQALLRENYGQIYSDIWKFGVNVSLRISDLLELKHEDLNLDTKALVVVEGKTGKTREIRLNKAATDIVKSRHCKSPTDVFLFQVHSNRTANQVKPISRISVSRAFKSVGELIGIKLNTHSMRKSRGFVMYSDGVPIEKISKVLNHSSPTTTMAYIGISKKDVLDTYDAYEL